MKRVHKICTSIINSKEIYAKTSLQYIKSLFRYSRGYAEKKMSQTL